MADMPLVVAVVDDDDGFREALRWLLTGAGYRVACYPRLGDFISGHDPSLLGCAIIDLRLGRENGIEGLRQARMKGHDAPALIISAYGDIPTAVLAMQVGALGFLEKPTDNDVLLAKVAEACDRHAAIRRSHGSASQAIDRYRRLTEREAEIYWLLVAGASNKEAALRLDISPRTAETHRARVYEKMEAGGLDDLVQWAFHLRPLFKSSEP